MSIKAGLMALLSEGPKYGAQLRSEFESRTGGTWPLNVGQVYTTLGRLERDGLVTQDAEPDEDGKIAYHLTPAGHDEVASWWQTPVKRDATPRDELIIKLSLAVAAGSVDVQDIIHTQRVATMKHLRQLTKRKQTALRDAKNGDPDESLLLVLEHLIFAAEGEVRWLDHAESTAIRLRRAAKKTATQGA